MTENIILIFCRIYMAEYRQPLVKIEGASLSMRRWPPWPPALVRPGSSWTSPPVAGSRQAVTRS
jgi:hypothetical protein